MSVEIDRLVEKITKEAMDKITSKSQAAEQKENAATQTASFNNQLITSSEIARMIDHTLLKPESTKEDIEKLCEEAAEFQFKTVCVNPYWVPTAAAVLKGSNVGITTVIGFPLGATSTFAKAAEARDAIAAGATEIDMVINIGAMKSGNYRSEEHTSELQSRFELVCRLLLEKKKEERHCNAGEGDKNSEATKTAGRTVSTKNGMIYMPTETMRLELDDSDRSCAALPTAVALQ